MHWGVVHEGGYFIVWAGGGAVGGRGGAVRSGGGTVGGGGGLVVQTVDWLRLVDCVVHWAGRHHVGGGVRGGVGVPGGGGVVALLPGVEADLRDGDGVAGHQRVAETEQLAGARHGWAHSLHG